MTSEEKWYMNGWRQGTRTIREFKHTKEHVQNYRAHIGRAKFGTLQGDAWNKGRKDACNAALGTNV